MICVTNENFTGIYDMLKNSVYSVAYSYMQNLNDASDIMQETFIKLLESKQQFNNAEHMKAWLLRVCSNACKNVLRDRKNHGETPLFDDVSVEEELRDDSVFEAVQRLPEKYRLPIHLFYYEDYSVKLISEVLSISESTAKVRLKRGRDMLRGMLEKERCRYV